MAAKIPLTELRKKVEQLIYKLNGVSLVPTTTTGTRVITLIPEDHIYPNYTLAAAAQQDVDYPKVSLSTDGGTIARNVGGRIQEKIMYDIVLIFKDLEHSEAESIVAEITENVADDFMYLVERNPRLMDTPGVESIDIEEWTTDSGSTFPEGTAYFRLSVSISR
jgi:hypothetical protein